MEISQFEEIIGYKFKNTNLCEVALTHSSYINEHGMGRECCNERIEFLGDAVLELSASDYIYREFPNLSEGEMTRMRSALVCEASLAKSAARIDLSKYIRLGKGEEKGGGRFRDSVLADAFEAVIGAIYLDGGILSAGYFIDTFVLDDAKDKTDHIDAKSKLQIKAQELLGATPVYEIIGSRGPDHQKTFMAEVKMNGVLYGSGTGGTKKQAEQEAAWSALKELEGKTACI